MINNLTEISTVASPLLVMAALWIGYIKTQNSSKTSMTKHNEDTYVRKDVCKVVHASVSNDLKEIKQDVKKLLSKNGLK